MGTGMRDRTRHERMIDSPRNALSPEIALFWCLSTLFTPWRRGMARNASTNHSDYLFSHPRNACSSGPLSLAGPSLDLRLF